MELRYWLVQTAICCLECFLSVQMCMHFCDVEKDDKNALMKWTSTQCSLVPFFFQVKPVRNSMSISSYFSGSQNEIVLAYVTISSLSPLHRSILVALCGISTFFTSLIVLVSQILQWKEESIYTLNKRCLLVLNLIAISPDFK